MKDRSPGLLNLPASLGISTRSRLATLLAVLGLLTTVLAPGCSRSSEHTNAYIRVNQVGYESGLPMRAYLMADQGRTGAEFTVKGRMARKYFLAR